MATGSGGEPRSDHERISHLPETPTAGALQLFDTPSTTETTTRLIDDLDGSDAQRTVTFAWGGRTYEVDLNKKNVAAFEKTMKPYLMVARSAERLRSCRVAGRGLGPGG